MKRLAMRPHNIRLIAADAKTATRRRNPTGLKVGELFACGHTYKGKTGRDIPGWMMPVAKCPVICRVTKVYDQPLGHMSNRDAWKEGASSTSAFIILWESLGKDRKWDGDQRVEVIEFELVSVNSELLEAM